LNIWLLPVEVVVEMCQAVAAVLVVLEHLH